MNARAGVAVGDRRNNEADGRLRGRWPVAGLVAIALVVSVAVGGAGAGAAASQASNGRLAFNRYRYTSSPFRGEVFVARADGSAMRRVTVAPANFLDEQPDWSPNGRVLAFARCPSDDAPAGSCRVYRVNADGSGLRQVGPGCTTPSACEFDLDPAWSPDGSRIAFTHEWGPVEGTPPNDQVAHSELFLMAADGSNVRQVTHLTDDGFTADIRGAAWSPGGKQLVFAVRESNRGRPAHGLALFVVGTDGRGLRQLTPWKLAAGDHPDWSADGSRILFTSVTGEDTGDLYTIGANGRGLRRLTHLGGGAVVQSGSYSPDGRSIVFATSARATPQRNCFGCPTYPDVFVMRADGTQVRPVTRTPNWDGSPDWGRAP